MPDLVPTPQFEEEIRAVVAPPQARTEFVNSLHARLLQQAASQSDKPSRSVYLRLAWALVLVVTLFVVGVLITGPQRVIAAVRGLFGYIPGVGIVEQNAPIRVLAEPVSLTRDGITLEITAATLTGDQTRIEYRIFGVPGSAYPHSEDVVGCIERPYLLLADGFRQEVDAPVPTNINEATYVMPCIFETLPGTAPTDWRLALKFVAAPPNMTVMPVTELFPSPETKPTQYTVTPGQNSTPSPVALEDHSVTVSKEIETADGYILVGSFQPQTQAGEQIQTTGTTLTDASGKEIPYSLPMDVSPDSPDPNTGGSGWAIQFKGYGLTYPLTISFTGLPIREVDSNATAEFTFDAGANPQPGQEWDLNQDVQLAGHTLKLVSIIADSPNGFSFRIRGDRIYSVGVEIAGYTAVGGGGGYSPEGMDSVSVAYTQMPTGLLTVILSHLTVTGDPLTWQGQWTPANPRVDFPTPQPGLCLDTDSFSDLGALPSDLAPGKALIYEQLADSGQWGLALYSLDGSQQQVVTTGGNWGSLAPDGSQVAYSAVDNGIHIYDIGSQIDRTIPGAFGFDLHWSPDGKQIAYIGIGNGTVNSTFVINTDGTNLRHVSELSYETMIGWSPDANLLYFAAPYTGGAAWKVYAYDFNAGIAVEQFTIENGTPKLLNPKLSPDGSWIVYRGKDNSSLYMVRTDGSDLQLVMDNAGVVGVEWTNSGWLGVGLKNPDTNATTIALVKPDGCEAYRAPSTMQGDLEGLFIP